MDWIAFCENKENFDKSHFYTLFFEGESESGRRSEKELETIFKFFPHSDELLQRIKNFISEDSAEITNYEEYLIENTLKDLSQKRMILEEEDEEELLDLLKKPVEFISNSQDVVNNRLEN